MSAGLKSKVICMSEYEKVETSSVKRHPERGHYDKETIYGIVDEALICHVAFAQDGQPFVIPTLHARQEDRILLHGAASSRLIGHIATGNEVCLAMTLVDGLVLARSAFSHSVNYRSAILFGRGTLIESSEEKMRALELLTEKVMPGRWVDVRLPAKNELKATSVVAISIDLGSAKIRQGPPVDDEADLQLQIWAGIVPLGQQVRNPIGDQQLRTDIQVPDYIQRYVESKAGNW